MAKRKRLAVWKLTSCDGCQLSLLDCEDELLMVAQEIEIAYFMEATSHVQPGPYDLSLVEGSISTPEQLEQIKKIRAESKLLVTIGACATSGGIQALRNFAKVEEFIKTVYTHSQYIETLATSTAVSEHVFVDFELQGCPISKKQLIEVLSSFLNGKKPFIPDYSVCVECKMAEVACLSVTQGIACLGPITHGGCEALCPRYERGCFGCFGPKELSQPQAWGDYLLKKGCVKTFEWIRLLRTFQTGASGFAKESERHGKEKN